MSSRSQPRPDRRLAPAVAFLLVLFIVQCFGLPPAAAAVPLPVAAVLPGAGQTFLVVDMGAGAGPVRGTAAAVTLDGVPQRTELVPVVSDLLAVTFVIDTSQAGAATLPSWLSAAARFILETPAQTQAAAVADAAPPRLIAPPQRGPVGIVSALSAVRAGGQRSTSDALTLALRQFPATPTGRRVVVLYTASADAGGERAEALSDRFRQSGTILVVVGTADDSAYWADAARTTGGFFAPAGTPVVVPALDQVETTLRGRYLVQFPTPDTLPARVSVRIETGTLTLTGDAIVPAYSAGIAGGRQLPASGPWVTVALTTIVGCLMVLVAASVIFRRRSAYPRTARAGGPAEDTATPTAASTAAPERTDLPRPVARGRAVVPAAPARGRASVPGASAKGRASVRGRERPP
jgi:von Willebrand factor type A domain